MVANMCLLKVMFILKDITNPEASTGLVHLFLCPALLRAACHHGTMDLSWSKSVPHDPTISHLFASWPQCRCSGSIAWHCMVSGIGTP